MGIDQQNPLSEKEKKILLDIYNKGGSFTIKQNKGKSSFHKSNKLKDTLSHFKTTDGIITKK